MPGTSGFRYPLIIQILLFVIPVNIYVLGDWLASGIQWILFRYQQSYLGPSIIGFFQDFSYLGNGILKGKSALAAMAGSVATFILVLAVILLIIAYYREDGTWIKKAAILNIAGGCLFLASDFLQYGLFLSGPSGFVIPIGIPVIIAAGAWMLLMQIPGENPGESGIPEFAENRDGEKNR